MSTEHVVQEPYIQPFNHNVTFLNERDVIISSDAWRVAIKLDTNTYEDAILTIRRDLRLIEGQKTEFTPVLELQKNCIVIGRTRTEASRFSAIHRDRRRGLIDLVVQY